MMLAEQSSYSADRFANYALGLILSLPSLYFLLSFPPLWRDSDGFYQITAKPGYLTLLHWPPLYCLTARIPIWLGDGIASRLSGRPVLPDLAGHSVLGDYGVESLILLQHAFLVLVCYFASISITKRPLLRVLIGGLFACTPWLYAFANCVGSEAYSNVFVVLTAICGWRVVRDLRLDSSLNSRELIGWFGALAGAILSRHVNAVLALLLPVTWMLALFLERVGRTSDQPQLSLRWRPLLTLVGLSLATIGACQLLTFALCVVYKVPYRSRVGYVFQWRLGYLAALSPEERNARLERIAKELDDPSVTYAVRQVELALGDKSGWQPELLSQAIYSWLRSNTMGSFRQRSLAMDAQLNSIAKAFLWSGDGALYEQIGRDFIESVEFTAPDITKGPFLATDWLKGHLMETVFLPVKSLKTFQDRVGNSVEQFARSPYCQLWSGVPLWVIGLCVLGLAVGLVIRRSLSSDGLLRYCYAIVLIATGLLLSLVNCSLTFLAPRFTLPMAISFLVAFCISLCEFAEMVYRAGSPSLRPRAGR